MNQKQAIEILLNAINKLNVNNGFFGATDGTIGTINIMQRDVNQALEALQSSGDTTKLQAIAGTLHAQGSLTDNAYEQIMEALEQEK